MKRLLALTFALLMTSLTLGSGSPGSVYASKTDRGSLRLEAAGRPLFLKETARANRKTIAANSVAGCTLAIKTNGTVVVVGAPGSYGQTNVIGWTNIVSIATKKQGRLRAALFFALIAALPPASAPGPWPP